MGHENWPTAIIPSQWRAFTVPKVTNAGAGRPLVSRYDDVLGPRWLAQPNSRRLRPRWLSVAVAAVAALIRDAFGTWHDRDFDGADLAIAATAIHTGSRLLTRNVRHYPMFPDLEPPY